MSMRVEISPVPTDEEVAAIVAAVEALWPKAVGVETSPVVRVPTWRFSNRWWITPLPRRRERPQRAFPRPGR
jgi:hypothetical protein